MNSVLNSHKLISLKYIASPHLSNFINWFKRHSSQSLLEMKQKVLITSSLTPQTGIEILQDKCDLIICCGQPATRQEILEKVKGVQGIYWCTKQRLDKEIVDAAGCGLKVVGTLSVGYDHIDTNLLKSRNIKLGNTADVLNDSVAEVAIGLCLMTSHRLAEGRDEVLANRMVLGVSNPGWLLGQQISGSVVGIVGLGRIGAEIARRIKAFKPSEIIYTGNQEKEEGRNLGARFVSLEELAQKSDFIIVSCLSSEKTRHMINKDVFDKTKSSAILINVSRGEVIDQDALIKALNDGRIWGAGLDVTTPEPLPPGHSLLSISRCVITAHQGSSTKKTRDAMAELTAKNILAGLFDEKLPSQVV